MYLLKPRRTGSIEAYTLLKRMMDSYKSYKRYSRKESIKKIFNIYSIKNN